MLEANSYRGANNRAYYAIFHAVSAVLAMEGVAFKKHKDTLAYFNKNYVATEIFPRNLGRKIVKAEETFTDIYFNYDRKDKSLCRMAWGFCA